MVLLNPVEGDHVYVLAPEAVIVVLCPLQIVFVPLTVTVGVVFTVTEAVVAAVLVQPAADVCVSV